MSAPANAIAVIVDGYSTGNFLPPAFARLGVDVIHVQSTPELNPSTLLPDLTAYVDNVVCADETAVNATVDALRAYPLVAVLAGQEPGVPLADTLSERLGLATNGSAQSICRRDKFHMIEAVRAAGLHAAEQCSSADVEELVGWAERRGRYPVVVKPLSSASTDHVVICRDAAHVREAGAAVLAARDIYDCANTRVLVQSYLAGTEYIVDTVSVDGQHYVCGVWQYEKRRLESGKNIYDKDILLAESAEPVSALTAYASQVLAALGIRHGPAHVEIIMTSEGPALVEVGARLNGNMNPGFHDVCLGANQADVAALAYGRPREFLERYAGRTYCKQQDAVVHNASTGLCGEVRAVDETMAKRISMLPTVYLLSVKLSPGKRLRPTVDLLTSPLRIFMTGTDRAALTEDYETIQTLKDGVYELQ